MKKASDFSFLGRANGLIFFTVCYLILPNTGLSQVPTVVLNGNSITDFIPLHSEKYVEPKLLPEVDIAAVLAEDLANGVEIPRFGIKIPTSVSKNEGEAENNGGFIIWKKSFTAPDAKSLNFEFTDLELPEGAKIYVYNSIETMYSGPIERKHVHEGKYSTDVIRGNEVIVEAVVPKEAYPSFAVNISNVIYGFQDIGGFQDNTAEDRAYNDSGTCNVDVNCPSGAGWGNQRDAVAMLLQNNVGFCSGALINNSCQDFDAFLLTAFHCLQGASGFLNWTFRFNYNSPNPTTPACRGAEPTTWLTYSGANLRASWATSDFALLELTGSIIGQSTTALAGWNRETTASTNGTSIHHPHGDVKKISTYNTPATRVDNTPLVPGALHWRVTWNEGVTEPGSSGSPLFDQNSRIVGQLSGGPSICGGATLQDLYGRFDNSWTGGGTSTTRLSDWLGANGNPQTLNAIRAPFINGTSPVCTSNKTFSLTNLDTGRTVTWAVLPTNLFATGSGAATSGSGTTATLRAASSNSSGSATLSFTIDPLSNCNGAIVVSIPIWVGTPKATLEGDDYLCFNSPGVASLDFGLGTTPLLQGASVSWSFVGPLGHLYGGPAIAKYKSLRTAGYGYITASLTNSCGTTQLSFPYEVADCGGIGRGLSIQTFPNPSRGTTTISVTEEPDDNSSRRPVQVIEGEYKIYNKFGRLAIKGNLISNDQEIDTSLLSPDTYILEIQREGARASTKLMIIK
ncbi:MAG: trypsin-like peptidase domain-containing protein [Saprospiraceae bacterium]|nr:trypsin-like peptidase domain-containing protein [Saprospiraceae bacterium]